MAHGSFDVDISTPKVQHIVNACLEIASDMAHPVWYGVYTTSGNKLLSGVTTVIRVTELFQHL